MKIGKLVRRFLTPSIVVSAYYYFRCGCRISPRAEVDMTPNLKIGKGTNVSSFAKIKAMDGPLVIGQHCSIGAGANIGSDTGGTYIGDTGR